jgi:cysteine desulfurase
MDTIYLDYNATTPLDAEVREAMRPFLGEVFGNASSVHRLGRQARAALDDARERVAQVWRCKPSEVIFTSGGTESVNLALLGLARARREAGRHVILSAIEHPAVRACGAYLARREGFEVTHLPVDTQGRVQVESLAAALRADTVLVSIMAANNEIGTVQPVAECGALCRERGVLFHTDAVQWLGKEPFAGMEQFQADAVSVCAHKLHGPKGAGALYLRSPLQLEPMVLGGPQELERRAGTENLAGIVGLASALERFVAPPVFDRARLGLLSQRLIELVDRLSGAGAVFRGSRQHRLVNTVAFTVAGCDSTALLAGLDLEGICASSGSACSAGALEPSHVLQALGVPSAQARSLVRFSLGRETTLAEVERVEAVLPKVIAQIQAAG